MRRFFIVGAVTFFIPLGGALAEECGGELDTLRKTFEGDEGYSLLMRSDIREEVSMLWRTAWLLDQKGNDEACNQIILAIQSLVSKTAASSSIMPADAWYQQELERLADAQPVEDVDFQLRTEEIIGASILTLRNEYIGDIDDVIFEDNQIAYAVLERGGFLGIGEERMAVPWAALSITNDRADFVLEIEQGDLDDAPMFEEGQWQDIATTEWRETNDAFFTN